MQEEDRTGSYRARWAAAAAAAAADARRSGSRRARCARSRRRRAAPRREPCARAVPDTWPARARTQAHASTLGYSLSRTRHLPPPLQLRAAPVTAEPDLLSPPRGSRAF